MNTATMVTLSRVFIAPFFAYAFMYGYNNGNVVFIWIAAILAGLIELSDMLDGTIARAKKEVTDFGKVCDPVADSVSRQTVFLSFMLSGIIPLWLYLVFFYRDAFLQLLRIICASNGIVLAARKSGKLKAVLQGIATFGVLIVVLLKLYSPTSIPDSILGFHPGFWVMLFPAIYTLLSVIDYVIPNRQLIANMMRKKQV
jgi:CDP-diacylglycerol--glycerol-3-phosphate 3-phosphatidyltransferase